MSGILDPKSRVIDAVFTVEGRRQLSEDRFQIKYVTFTDADVVYQPDAADGHIDPAGKIYLEACNLPQDRIVFETDTRGGGIKSINPDASVFSNAMPSMKSAFTVGNFVGGEMLTSEYQYKPRLLTTPIKSVEYSTSDGFIYSDPVGGVTASIFFDPFSRIPLTFEDPANTFPGNGPYISTIGVSDDPSSDVVATRISNAINAMSASTGAGPKIFTTTQGSYVFFDYPGLGNINLQYLGQLKSDQFSLLDTVSGGRRVEEQIVGDEFLSQISGQLTASFDNFLGLKTLASIDFQKNDQNFTLSSNTVSFSLSNIPPAYKSAIERSDVDISPSIFLDDKFSNLPEYRYLPPILKTDEGSLRAKFKKLTSREYSKTDIPALLDSPVSEVATLASSYLLGNYPAFGRNTPMQFTGDGGLKSRLDKYGPSSKSSITFDQTSLGNRLLGQFFEVVSDGTVHTVNKLDMVDYGSIKSPDGTNLRVFFLGKRLLDKMNTSVFINMFTLIYSQQSTNL